MDLCRFRMLNVRRRGARLRSIGARGSPRRGIFFAERTHLVADVALFRRHRTSLSTCLHSSRSARSSWHQVWFVTLSTMSNTMEWEKPGPPRTRSIALKKLRVRKINTTEHAVQHVATRSVVCGDGAMPG